MFHQQNSDPLLSDSSDQAAQFVHLGRVHTGSGFIEKQKPRLAGERAGDLDATLIAERKFRRLQLPLGRKADKVENLPCLLGCCPLTAGEAKQRCRIAHDTSVHPDVTADHDVLDNRQAADEPDVLEISGYAHLLHTIRPLASVVATVEGDAAGGRPKSPAYNIKQRRFAGAVGTDQGMNMSLGYVARDIVQGKVSAKAATHTDNAEKSAHVRCERRAGSNPSGRQIAITTKSVPNMVIRQSCTTRSISGSSVTMAAPTMGPNGFPVPPKMT